MKYFQVSILLATLLQINSASHVAVRMPYQNPAGVTYINNYDPQYTYTTGSAAPLSYAPGAPLQYAAAPQLQYVPVQYAAAGATPVSKIEAHHVGYAHAQVPALASVPFVKHVPTVSQVPITRYEAHPAVLEKQVDVLKPAISTRKVEVRRPAIQKQFYDVEERIIIRPAGSALVELEEPTAKLERGPAVVQSLHGQHQIPNPLAFNPLVSTQYHGYFAPGSFQIQPQQPQQQEQPQKPQQTPMIDGNQISTPSSVGAASGMSEEESVVVENADFRSVQHQQERLQSNSIAYSQVRGASSESQSNEITSSQSNLGRLIASDPSPVVVESQRSSDPQENQSNQNKLIELLTARGGVTEVGFGRQGSAGVPIGDAGQIRARVISATPAPENAEPSGERVSTRRVVVSRPIETLQELDVVEPATKLERVSVQQPTFIKTARLDHVQVHGSVPVLGKALAPTLAHTSIPIYQKTISPALAYYRR